MGGAGAAAGWTPAAWVGQAGRTRGIRPTNAYILWISFMASVSNWSGFDAHWVFSAVAIS